MSTFGELLKIDRERLQLSQEELAKRVGVSQQAVANWENGTSQPRKDRRVLLFQVLGPDAELVKNPPSTEFIPAKDMPADLVVKTTPGAASASGFKFTVRVDPNSVASRAAVGTPMFTYTSTQPWIGFSTAKGTTVQAQAERTKMLLELQEFLPEPFKAHVGSDLMFGQVARQYDYASSGVVARVMRGQTAVSASFSAIHIVRLAMAVRENEPSHEPTPSVVLFILSGEPAAVVTRRMGATHFDAMTLGIKVEVAPDVKAIANTIVELERAYAQDIADYNAWMIEMHRQADEHVFGDDPELQPTASISIGEPLMGGEPDLDPPEQERLRGTW